MKLGREVIFHLGCVAGKAHPLLDAMDRDAVCVPPHVFFVKCVGSLPFEASPALERCPCLALLVQACIAAVPLALPVPLRQHELILEAPALAAHASALWSVPIL